MAQPWSHYFTFPAGTSFKVDGPLKYDGRGHVHANTDRELGFELHMPAAKVLGFTIPGIDAVVDVTYAQEGPGNHVRVTANGTTHEDPDATIVSDDEKRRRTVTSSVQIGGKPLVISLRARKDDEIDARINGYDFDLEREEPPEVA
jgi:hypothetical protein